MFWRWMLGKWKSHPSAKVPPLPVILYTRSSCPLCDEALAMLQHCLEVGEVRMEIRDVDADPQWQARYGDKVPVVEVEGTPRLWGRISKKWLRRLIQFHRRRRQTGRTLF